MLSRQLCYLPVSGRNYEVPLTHRLGRKAHAATNRSLHLRGTAKGLSPGFQSPGSTKCAFFAPVVFPTMRKTIGTDHGEFGQ